MEYAFFPPKKSLEAASLAQMLGGELRNIPPEKLLLGVATLNKAHQQQISFFHNAKYKDALFASQAGLILLDVKNASLVPDKPTLIVDNPYYRYAQLLLAFYSHLPVKPDTSAVIPATVSIGKGSIIGSGVILGEGVVIGNNVVIGDGVVIGSNSHISDNVTIECAILGAEVMVHSGARIGQPGFGFAPSRAGVLPVLQIGAVRIGNRVRVGANTCIDRGALEDTIIGDDTKIDNLVQIAHNVVIGRNCFIAAQTGIAGSTTIGDFVMLGGQVGIAGHLEIGSQVNVAAQSGVIADVEAGMKMGGYPALPIMDWHRITAKLKQLIKKS